MSRPLTRTQTTYFSGSYPNRSYYMGRSGWTGDHVIPLRYDAKECTSTRGQYPNGNGYFVDAPNTFSSYEFHSYDGIPPWSVPAANSAYAELREALLGSESQVGAALGEWRSSLDMIANRASQLAHSAIALRRRNFVYLLSVWRSRPHKPGSPEHGKARKAANLWLEWSFGWKPLLGDIKSAADQISEPLPDAKPCVGARSDSEVSYNNWGYLVENFHRNVTHRMGAAAKLTSPNLFLASQLGLVNPLSVAWELIPGSFVADWMFDIGSFLGSMSDFIGVEVINPWRASYLNYGDSIRPSGGQAAICSGWGMVRRPGLYRPTPNLEIRRNVGGSLSRAASAVALATQALTSPGRIA